MKKGGFKSPKGIQKTKVRPPGAGKSKPMVGRSALPFNKGGMVNKGKKC